MEILFALNLHISSEYFHKKSFVRSQLRSLSIWREAFHISTEIPFSNIKSFRGGKFIFISPSSASDAMFALANKLLLLSYKANLNAIGHLYVEFRGEISRAYVEGIPVEDFKAFEAISGRSDARSKQNRSEVFLLKSVPSLSKRVPSWWRKYAFMLLHHCTSYIHTFALDLGEMLSKMTM